MLGPQRGGPPIAISYILHTVHTVYRCVQLYSKYSTGEDRIHIDSILYSKYRYSRAAEGAEFEVMGIYCVHYIEQKDCSVQLG